MSYNNKGFNSYVYIPLILTLIFLIGCFAVALTTISNEDKLSYTMDNVSSFDIVSKENEYSYVQKEEKDGIKYYVISTPDDSIPVNWDSAISSVMGNQNSSREENVSKPDENGKVAYLTFDDGPSKNTEKILDILDEYNVKATFFVIYHKNMGDRYKAIVDRGHSIALHSYTHNYKKIYSSTDAYFADLNKISDYVESVTGVKSHIIRFPGGSSNTVSNKYSKGIMKKLRKAVVDKGYSYHDWNVDSKDASGNNVDKDILLESVKSSLNKYKEVDILMHDTGEAKETTVEALPNIIEYVKSQGYSMECITEDTKPIRHSR